MRRRPCYSSLVSCARRDAVMIHVAEFDVSFFHQFTRLVLAADPSFVSASLGTHISLVPGRLDRSIKSAHAPRSSLAPSNAGQSPLPPRPRPLPLGGALLRAGVCRVWFLHAESVMRPIPMTNARTRQGRWRGTRACYVSVGAQDVPGVTHLVGQVNT